MDSENKETNINTGKVEVVVRCRPLLSNELVGTFGRSSITIPPPQLSSSSTKTTSNGITKDIFVGTQGKGFSFDQVFGPQATQSHLYKSVNKLIQGLFEGYNGSILAYGQTGSGKTYTMGTSVDTMGDIISNNNHNHNYNDNDGNNNDDNNNNNTSSSHQLANSMPLAPTHEIEMSDRRSTTTNDTKSKKDYGHKVAL